MRILLLSLFLAAAGASAQRVANTTLALPPTPPAAGTNGYTAVNAFGSLTFTTPLALAVPPGETNRLFVVERSGVIAVVTNLASPTRSVFMNIGSRISLTGEGGLLALAFHPHFASNGHFFVWYTAAGTGFSNRLSRFTVSATNWNQGNTNSEVVLFGQHDDCPNHNGGDLKFGADGYLYVSLGDEGDSNDRCGTNSQNLAKHFFSGVLRLDVDQRPGSLRPNHHPSIIAPTNYAIPPDNPFIGFTQFNGLAVSPDAVRTEYWALGLRNPFRMSFDPPTGDLYVGDVGQGQREEVDLIRKGGNYGWRWREGTIATPGLGVLDTPPAGFTNAISPLLDYARPDGTNRGTTVTGGHVYRGALLPELYGKYVFSDYNSGHVWALAHNGSNATAFGWLLTEKHLVYFLPDPRDGEMLLADAGDNAVKKIMRSALPTNALPAALSGVGAFTNLATLAPAPGVVPYALNVPFWSDHAIKSRWFAVPSTNLVITFNAEQPWTFPTSTVWVKHFELELTSGVPASARRIETRFLVKNAGGGYGITYRWGDSLTNAYLVPEEGFSEPILINDGGTVRTQVWVYPSRSQCLSCHLPGAGFALGFGTAQLNRDAPDAPTNQLLQLSSLGYFHTNLASVHLLRRLAAATDSAWSLEYRVRSYLQANCAACHFPGGPTPAAWDARIVNPLALCGIVDGALANSLGDPLNRVVVPADVPHSMLHTRITTRGANQMPPLGSTVVDTQGVALVAAWIAELTAAGLTNDLPPAGWSHTLDLSNGVPVVRFERAANRGFEVQRNTNLLDASWLPLDQADNAPYFAASNAPAAVADPVETNGAFYRVRVFAP